MFREDCLFLTLFLGVGGQIFSGLRRGTRLKELNSGFRFEGFPAVPLACGSCCFEDAEVEFACEFTGVRKTALA